jgi:hypothetical protein
MVPDKSVLFERRNSKSLASSISVQTALEEPWMLRISVSEAVGLLDERVCMMTVRG